MLWLFLTRPRSLSCGCTFSFRQGLSGEGTRRHNKRGVGFFCSVPFLVPCRSRRPGVMKHASAGYVYVAAPATSQPACSHPMTDTPSRLTSKQRAHLRSLAHTLDPVVRVGKEGLTEAVVSAVEEAFNTRELLKARILDAAAEDARYVAHALAERLDNTHVVQVVGHVAILYRPDPDDPRIEIPR